MNGTVARWTTPSLSYKPEKMSAEHIVKIEVVFSQLGREVIHKTMEDAQLVSGRFYFDFTQEETGMLRSKVETRLKIDYLGDNGRRYTTGWRVFNVDESAVNGVI